MDIPLIFLSMTESAFISRSIRDKFRHRSLNINSPYSLSKYVYYFSQNPKCYWRSLITLLQMSAVKLLNLRANKRCQLPTFSAQQYT